MSSNGKGSHNGGSARVVVVGAGHNGLVTAAYLARARLDVTVVERRHIVGGLCVTDEVFPGYRGNIVANSAHNLEPRIVHELELDRHGLKFAYPEPAAFMAFPDGRAYVSWQDPAERVRELAKFSKRDVEAYPAALEYLNEFARTLNVSFFEAPPTWRELTERLRTPADEDAFTEIFFGSVEHFVNSRLHSEELKAALTIVALVTNLAGPSTPGTTSVLLQRPLYAASAPTGGPDFHNLGASRWTPVGGMGAVTQALARSAEAAGASIRLNAEVAQIITDNGRVSAVALASGEEIPADIVVANASPKSVLLNMVDPKELAHELRQRLERLNPEGQSFKVLVALDGLPLFNSARDTSENDLFVRCGFRMAPTVAAMEQCYAESKAGRWSSIPMIWGFIPSIFDPTLTPPGKHIMSLSCGHAPYHLANGTWDEEKHRFGQHILNVLGNYISNLHDIIRDTHYVSPLDMERDFNLPGGHGTYGDILPGQMFANRPVQGCSDYRTPVFGLYLCGNGTWPANFVSGISGLNAANTVLRDAADPEAAAAHFNRQAEDSLEANPTEFGPG